MDQKRGGEARTGTAGPGGKRRRVALLVGAASRAGHPLPLETLGRLVGAVIEREPLPEGVELRDGLLVPRGISLEGELERWRVARVREWAQALTSSLRIPREAVAMGICGSLAYGTMKWGDDVDLYLVVEPGRLWIGLFRTFLALRALALKLRLAHIPFRLCLSYAIDTNELARLLGRPSPLEAVEAAASIPLLGEPLTNFATRGGRERRGASPTNQLLRALLTPYLRLKQHLLNSIFRRRGEYDRMFRYIIGLGLFTTTSRRYEAIRHFYEVFTDET